MKPQRLGLWLASLSVAACSAPGGDVDRTPSAERPSATDSFGITPGAFGRDQGPTPSNLGSEQACDGIDENGNGVIDDVDSGRDGLCDCLNIGFLGEVRSDAGTATAAFEDWLEARSETPVLKLAAETSISDAVLAPLQVLVIGNLTGRVGKPYSSGEIGALQRWLEQRGGGLMVLAGFTAIESHMDPTVALLGPTELGYDYKGRGAGVLSIGAPPVKVTGFPDPMHPTVEGVAALGVYAAYPVTGNGESLLEQAGFVLARARDFGRGRVFAFADEWITQDRLWLPQQTTQTQCQQQCRQCADQCRQCDNQCQQCTLQPCTGSQVVDPTAVCARGCDEGCGACQLTCTSCSQTCQVCSAEEAAIAPEVNVPRFWLNVFRWLSPANECQVEIPAFVDLLR